MYMVVPALVWHLVPHFHSKPYLCSRRTTGPALSLFGVPCTASSGRCFFVPGRYLFCSSFRLSRPKTYHTISVTLVLAVVLPCPALPCLAVRSGHSEASSRRTPGKTPRPRTLRLRRGRGKRRWAKLETLSAFTLFTTQHKHPRTYLLPFRLRRNPLKVHTG